MNAVDVLITYGAELCRTAG